MHAGLKKKLVKLVKKGYPELQEWIRSISNHLYWCAASGKDKNPDMIVAKWMSVCDHIINKHKGHKNPLFPTCMHPSKPTKGKKKKKWLKPSMHCNF